MDPFSDSSGFMDTGDEFGEFGEFQEGNMDDSSMDSSWTWDESPDVQLRSSEK